MSIGQIAEDLIQLCRTGNNVEAIEKYYDDSVVSVESASAPGSPKEMQGKETIKQKNKWWIDNHEVHGAEANGPFVGENQFAIEFKYDVTQKQTGQRIQMNEMALYTVRGGKIVREHFFYNPGSF